MARRKKLQPLVVDGYNVIFATPRYQALIDEETTGEPYLGHDAHVRSRAALISDVAAFASGSYRATIVFDGSGNVNPERLPLQVGGVDLIFSLPGEQADEVIERLAGEARQRGEAITVISSDSTVQATMGGIPITRLSSKILLKEVEALDVERSELARRGAGTHLTVEDRLDPVTRAKLNQMIGRG